MAKCRFVICLLTESAAASPFVFHEVLFYSWFGKNRSIVTLLFKNVWSKLKTPLKAILGKYFLDIYFKFIKSFNDYHMNKSIILTIITK